ncbi:MAG: hypothetical protein Q9213_008289 [Squamulea squamosa]
MTPSQPAVMTRSAAAAANQSNSKNNSDASPSATATATTTATTTGQNSQTGRAFLNRIERIEKEQLENKNMLTQILGAVTRQASAEMSYYLIVMAILSNLTASKVK